MPCCRKKNDYDSDSDESLVDGGIDKCGEGLSYVGTAAYEVLRKKHRKRYHKLWNVNEGKIVGDVYVTPKDACTREDAIDPEEGHSDWFPEKLGELVSRTEQWCDVVTLAPPDGRFMKAFKEALKKICEREVVLGRKVTIRMMFGNIVTLPVNCTALIRELTKDLPKNAPSKIRLWVGSWRKGVSWNHAKIIAVDGKYLWTGGHNFWDKHYLRNNPTNDISLELEGEVARDAHKFANEQWAYIVRKQSTPWGRFVDRRIPDAWDVPRRSRVTVSAFPETSASEFPPCYKYKRHISRRKSTQEDPNFVPIISMGRYATLLRVSRPSDDAFLAMFDSARDTIRLAIQDIGPVLLPGTRWALPGLSWPEPYLKALARAIWLNGVQVEIILSNPNSVPGNCSQTEANYGNGWNCVEVAAEIVKAIQKQFPKAPHGDLRHKVEENLRVCFVRSPKGGRQYKDGLTLGLHSKHFIVDDICCYIGSQNLYVCDLAEWGVVIDHPEQVQSIKSQYWDPMWKVSYARDDCDVQLVMDALKIERSAPSKLKLMRLSVINKHDKVKSRFESMYIHRESHEYESQQHESQQHESHETSP